MEEGRGKRKREGGCFSASFFSSLLFAHSSFGFFVFFSPTCHTCSVITVDLCMRFCYCSWDRYLWLDLGTTVINV